MATNCERFVYEREQAAVANAYEAFSYAREHDLVLGFETADHLGYHEVVAQAEYARISQADRSLSHAHLEEFHIPQPNVAESWTVPRRIAAILESACSRLDDDTLRYLRAAYCCSASSAPSSMPATQHVKLEQPLLLRSIHLEDCATLQRTIEASAVASSAAREERVRKLCGVLQEKPSDELFAVPQQARQAAWDLDESLATETMAVTEQAVGCIAQMIGAMELKSDDKICLLQEQAAYQAIKVICLSPPLTPVSSPTGYFVPDGDICAVSDASDLSSGVTEALEGAENALNEVAGDVWQTDGAVQPADLASMLPGNDDCLPALMKCRAILLDPAAAQATSKAHSRPSPLLLPDPAVSGLAGGGSIATDRGRGTTTADSLQEPNDGVQWPADGLHTVRGLLETDESDGSSTGNFEEHDMPSMQLVEDTAADSFLDVDNHDLVVTQAKLPVPATIVRPSLPPWSGIAPNPQRMLDWMRNNYRDAFCLHEWPDPDGSLQDEASKYNWGGWDSCSVQETATLLVDEMAVASALSAFLKTDVCTMDRLMQPEWMGPLPKQQHGAKDEPELEALVEEVTPETDNANNAIDIDDGGWDTLTSQWKRRKTQTAGMVHGSLKTKHRVEDKATSASFTAPELAFGLNAFSNGTGQVNSYSGTEAAKNKLSPRAASPGKENDSLRPQPPIDATMQLPRVVFSLGLPRLVRSHLVDMLPHLSFIERDYSPQQPQQKHKTAMDQGMGEVDITLSPSTGMIVATVVGLRQSGRNQQQRSPFQQRLVEVSAKYDKVVVLVYRAGAGTKSGDGSGDDMMVELSPSDAMALTQLQGFVRRLPGSVAVLYIGGGEPAVARWAAAILCRQAEAGERGQNSRRLLSDVETPQALDFRRAGLSVYDAQIVGQLVRESTKEVDEGAGGTEVGDSKQSCDNMVERFGGEVGCRRALVKAAATMGKQSHSTSSPPFVHIID